MNEICKPCSTGNDLYPHNEDPIFCRLGRLQSLQSLPEKQQIERLYTEEMIDPCVAKMIIQLAKERSKTILETLTEEKLLS